jgi:hypothetical protein
VSSPLYNLEGKNCDQPTTSLLIRGSNNTYPGKCFKLTWTGMSSCSTYCAHGMNLVCNHTVCASEWLLSRKINSVACINTRTEGKPRQWGDFCDGSQDLTATAMKNRPHYPLVYIAVYYGSSSTFRRNVMPLSLGSSMPTPCWVIAWFILRPWRW